MHAPQPFDSVRIDVEAGLAQQLIGEEPAAHADLAMDAPDGQLDVLGIERSFPGQHMLIDAVDQRAVQVEQKDGLDAHREDSFVSRAGYALTRGRCGCSKRLPDVIDGWTIIRSTSSRRKPSKRRDL